MVVIHITEIKLNYYYYYYYRTEVHMKCIQQNKNKNILVHMQAVLCAVAT